MAHVLLQALPAILAAAHVVAFRYQLRQHLRCDMVMAAT